MFFWKTKEFQNRCQTNLRINIREKVYKNKKSYQKRISPRAHHVKATSHDIEFNSTKVIGDAMDPTTWAHQRTSNVKESGNHYRTEPKTRHSDEEVITETITCHHIQKQPSWPCTRSDRLETTTRFTRQEQGVTVNYWTADVKLHQTSWKWK